MSGGTGDNTVSVMTEEIQEKISEEVGKALEASLPGFMERLQNTILSIVEERINELKEDLIHERGKVKEKKGCPYNKFMACKPLIYNGKVDPIACQRWISDIEGVFERTHCDVSDFVAYETGQLRGQAKDWWDNLRNEKGDEATRAMTWEDFKTPFLKHHSPKATEEQKIYYYHNILRAEYREFVTPSNYENLTDIINAAREREIELKKQIEIGERRALAANPSPTKKPKVTKPSRKGNVKEGSPSCEICGRAHRGKCFYKDKPCVLCGKMGHGVSNCPDKVTVCYKFYQSGHKKSECPKLTGKKEGVGSKIENPKAKSKIFPHHCC
ncbi:uncharacterized protein LOC110906378 [Helianthus annuus]|uniref:uncharacterized protein LOC110906378 n=1 Tax=Helianthus annuus TaxID=4232 RepID=UPI000B8FBA7E|nr:uncharacterized protein LOC110906378 [Helianthus annuus]